MVLGYVFFDTASVTRVIIHRIMNRVFISILIQYALDPDQSPATLRSTCVRFPHPRQLQPTAAGRKGWMTQ